jgi:phosphoesterase RecJ-like protein
VKRIGAEKFSRLLESLDSIALFGHVSPDGDCFGAVYSLKIALERMGKKVSVHLSDSTPEFIAFLKDYAFFVSEDEAIDAKAVIICDTPDWKRVENASLLSDYQNKSAMFLLLDHHQEGDLIDRCDFAWQDSSMSSTSEMVLKLFQKMGIAVDRTLATLLLTGLETDTSSFQNQNTTSETFKNAATLMSKGARLGAIINNAFMTKKSM